MDQDGGPGATQSRAEGQPIRLSWAPPAGLVGLSFANFALRLLTLGLYNFWAKTEIRRRVWSAIRLDGEPLSYTGTGKELFLGFLIIFGILLLPTTLISLAVFALFGGSPTVTGIYQVVVMAVFFFLTGVAIYRAQRYRLSRTRWRGIRGSLDGDSWGFGWTYFWTIVVPFGGALILAGALIYAFGGSGQTSVFAQSLNEGRFGTTLGLSALAVLPLLAASWIFPWRSTKLQSWLTSDMKFGDRSFRFIGEPGPLYRPFAVFWFGVALLVVGTIAVSVLAAFGLGQLGTMGADDSESIAFNPLMILGVLGVIYGVLPVAYLVYLLLSAFYRARQFNHFANHTLYEGARLRSTVTGRGLVWNAIGNFFLRVLGTIIGLLILGGLFAAVAAVTGTEWLQGLKPVEGGAEPPMLLMQAFVFASIVVLAASASLFGPIIQARTTRYLVENLSIEGNVPLAEIAQGADQGITRGEGLAQAFDVDAF